MSDRRKEAEEKMAKAIFISADCWLCVFDLITPSQLGLGISMISHRFNFYVDEHFKTRKWAVGIMRIESKIGENDTKKMGIVNCYGEPMPIPQVQMPRKVIGFKRITIYYIDQNAIAFLRHFHQLFATCSINLAIDTTSDRISEYILRNILPMIEKNIHFMELSAGIFHRFRQIVPSILNDCPSLRFVCFNFHNLFAEFPCDDSATASDGQAVAKWLLTPLQNDVPKMYKCSLDMDYVNWSSKIAAFKAAFASASSPANFIISISFPPSFADSVMPFALTNELTREQLMLKRINNSQRFLLIRCPIVRGEIKWTKWEEEAFKWKTYNQCNVHIGIFNDDDIGKELLNATPGPSDQQQK
ncbi:hypothetical protein niasHT_034177 [Heterodera trifolii]|uniref:F-box domain-containing protein n=1 Tax=Heterodera trifolii TaxID=157864 RepID=A0ABD2IS21_9BILA